VQSQNRRYLRAPAKTARDGHVQLGWHKIGKIVNAQSRLVGINALRLVVPISRPKRLKDEVGAFRPGELS
jgi:hypothetical protein